MRAKLLNFHLNQDKCARNYRCIGNFIVKLENLRWFKVQNQANSRFCYQLCVLLIIPYFQFVGTLFMSKGYQHDYFTPKVAVFLQFFHGFAGRGVILHCIFSAKRVKHWCKDKRLSHGLGSKSHEMAQCLTFNTLPMVNNNNNTMGQLVVMTRADLDALLQDAIAASRSLVPEPVKENLLPSMADEYVTRQQAAKILHLDVSSLWRLEKSGRLVPCRASDRRVLYRKADLEAYLNSKKGGVA